MARPGFIGSRLTNLGRGTWVVIHDIAVDEAGLQGLNQGLNPNPQSAGLPSRRTPHRESFPNPRVLPWLPTGFRGHDSLANFSINA